MYTLSKAKSQMSTCILTSENVLMCKMRCGVVDLRLYSLYFLLCNSQQCVPKKVVSQFVSVGGRWTVAGFSSACLWLLGGRGGLVVRNGR